MVWCFFFPLGLYHFKCFTDWLIGLLVSWAFQRHITCLCPLPITPEQTSCRRQVPLLFGGKTKEPGHQSLRLENTLLRRGRSRGRSTIGHECPGQDVWVRTSWLRVWDGFASCLRRLVRTSWPGHLCPIVLLPLRTLHLFRRFSPLGSYAKKVAKQAQAHGFNDKQMTDES